MHLFQNVQKFFSSIFFKAIIEKSENRRVYFFQQVFSFSIFRQIFAFILVKVEFVHYILIIIVYWMFNYTFYMFLIIFRHNIYSFLTNFPNLCDKKLQFFFERRSFCNVVIGFIFWQHSCILRYFFFKKYNSKVVWLLFR